uniref:hypothetical protein n=1 Tax=Streptomyces canus TaxID=58343 RepID=UPI00131AB9A5
MSRSPAIRASSMARPETPMMSEATAAKADGAAGDLVVEAGAAGFGISWGHAVGAPECGFSW